VNLVGFIIRMYGALPPYVITARFIYDSLGHDINGGSAYTENEINQAQLQWLKLLWIGSDVTAQVQVHSQDARKNTPVSMRCSLALFPDITSAVQIGALGWNSHLRNTTTPPQPLPPHTFRFPTNFKPIKTLLFCCGVATRRRSWPPLPDNIQLTTDKHPCARWDSKPRSQQASGCRPTP
jgi:hypothetical protein